MDCRIISEATPTDIFSGRIWIKPSTMMCYIRLGTDWIPLAGSASGQVTFQRVTVLINGIDRTGTIEKNTLVITDILTNQVDQCTFAILTDSTFLPQVGMEVLVFYKSSATATPEIRFGGRITNVPQEQISTSGLYRYEITASDFSQELLKQQVTDSFEDELAGDIIKAIVGDYAKGLGTYYVEDGLTIDFISFNSTFVFEAIEELAKLIGYDWYVDYNRNIHFFPSTTNAAPYNIDTSQTFFRELVIEVDKSQLKNRQVVRGGYEFSSLYTQEDEADGTQESFTLRYEPYAPITVYVDSGGGYIEQTLGIDNIDTGKDFVYNVNEKVIKNQDHAKLTAGHKIKITYTYKIPIFSQDESAESIVAMKEREGQDGIYEGEIIIDDTIETKEAAHARAKAEIDQYSNPLVQGSFITNTPGFRSGQLITIDLPDRGENANQYLIQQVTATSLGMGNFEYEVEFARRLTGLVDFLILLYDRGKKIFIRDDVILDTYKKMPTTYVDISESAPVSSLRNTTTSPYKWSNDEGTTSGKGRWNLAQWG